jgi:carbon storage regulator CsrA
MLVLSRRQHQKLILPDSETTIEVVCIKGSQVRLGITAPSHVRVLRDELTPRELARHESARGERTGGELPQAGAVSDGEGIRRLRHLLRNQVHTSTIGLALLRGQLQAGQRDEAAATLARLEDALSNVREQCHTLESAAAPADRGRRRALLVEDNHNERELLAGFLRMSGFEVATAGDGADALDYLQSNAHPDVLLLDMVMPRCDGPTTVRRIRANPETARLKIFAVSGVSPQQLSVASGPTGVDAWFPKPVDPNTLVAELNRAINGVDRQGVLSPRP